MAETVHRMRVTMTFEYDASPQYYDDADPVAMAATDQEVFRDDPYSAIETAEGHGLTVTVAPVTEGRPGAVQQ